MNLVLAIENLKYIFYNKKNGKFIIREKLKLANISLLVIKV